MVSFSTQKASAQAILHQTVYLDRLRGQPISGPSLINHHSGDRCHDGRPATKQRTTNNSDYRQCNSQQTIDKKQPEVNNNQQEPLTTDHRQQTTDNPTDHRQVSTPTNKQSGTMLKEVQWNWPLRGKSESHCRKRALPPVQQS